MTVADFPGQSNSPAGTSQGSSVGSGESFLSVSTSQGGLGGGGGSVIYYSLAAFDTSNVRRYWTDTSVSFTNAPTPVGSYVTATLTVLG